MSYDYVRMAAGAILPMIFDTGSTVSAPSPSPSPPVDTITVMHANVVKVSVNGLQGEQTLLDSSVSVTSIVAGSVIVIEAYGDTQDPGPNGPDFTFVVKWKSTVIWTATVPSIASGWSFRCMITVRSTGATGKVEAAALAMQNGAGSISNFPTTPTQTTVDTTGTVGLDLRASITDFTGGEVVDCEQAVVYRLS